MVASVASTSAVLVSVGLAVGFVVGLGAGLAVGVIDSAAVGGGGGGTLGGADQRLALVLWLIGRRGGRGGGAPVVLGLIGRRGGRGGGAPVVLPGSRRVAPGDRGGVSVGGGGGGGPISGCHGCIPIAESDCARGRAADAGGPSSVLDVVAEVLSVGRLAVNFAAGLAARLADG